MNARPDLTPDPNETRVAGWLIGVMVEVRGERTPVRHFFAVGQPDRARAEWKAVDRAQDLGPIAVSPVGGLEPVHAVVGLTPHRLRLLGVLEGQVHALGAKWPRWLTLGTVE